MKVSHEVPLCLLDESRAFNDYDYCLPHLLDEYPEYLQYFIDSKKYGRYIIMDNSLHELGEAYNTERLLHWVNFLKPNEFIVPDVWEDAHKTYDNALKWKDIELPEETTKVVVIQGKYIEDIEWLISEVKYLHYQKIAFSYGGSIYEDYSNHPNIHIRKALGRTEMLSELLIKGIITEEDRIHLLGCQVPQEFGFYEGWKCIESIDTSNPIMATLDGEYYMGNGLLSKPISNMNNNFILPYEEIDQDILRHNVKMFREINSI